MEQKVTYLNNITYFRGIAIVFIVFGHCTSFGITRFHENTTFLAKIIKLIVPGGTIFFVFISGYLFHHIYNKNFKLKTFLLKKMKNVLIPFYFFCSIDIIYYLTRLFFAIVSQSKKTEFFLNKINSYSYFETFFLGHAEIPMGLWYVPFIMVIFSLSKFYMKFVLINYKTQLLIISSLMLIAAIIHRAPDASIKSIFQNILYFTPVYLLGIFVSLNSNMFYTRLRRKAIYLLLFALAIAFLQAKIGGLIKMNDLSTIDFRNFDFMIIQKSILSIFFMTYLMKFEYKKISLFNLLAKNSFGIFFIHGIYIFLIHATISKLQIFYKSDSIIIFIVSGSLVLILSLFTTIILRKLLSNKSKYIIGC